MRSQFRQSVLKSARDHQYYRVSIPNRYDFLLSQSVKQPTDQHVQNVGYRENSTLWATAFDVTEMKPSSVTISACLVKVKDRIQFTTVLYNSASFFEGLASQSGIESAFYVQKGAKGNFLGTPLFDYDCQTISALFLTGMWWDKQAGKVFPNCSNSRLRSRDLPFHCIASTNEVSRYSFLLEGGWGKSRPR